MPTAAVRPPDFPSTPRVFATFDDASNEVQSLEARLRERNELVKLRHQTEQDAVELAEASEWLATNAAQPAPDDLDPEWLAEAAAKAKDKERATVELFQPVIKKLKSLLVPTKRLEPEVEQYVREGVNILEGWLAFYRGVHELLMRQLAQRLSPSGNILRARLAKRKIDYAELSREHIARYPKIRARLAE